MDRTDVMYYECVGLWLAVASIAALVTISMFFPSLQLVVVALVVGFNILYWLGIQEWSLRWRHRPPRRTL